MLFICKPTGLSFDGRHWEVGDLADLGRAAQEEAEEKDPRGFKRPNPDGDNLIVSLLKLADKGVSDPGPYKGFTVGQKVDWEQVTVQDIYAAALAVRIKTKRIMEIRPQCGGCGKLPPEPRGIPLDEIKVYEASEEGLEVIQSGNSAIKMYGQYGEHISEGGEEPPYVTVALKPIRGKDMKTLDRLQEQDRFNVLEWQIVCGIEWIQLHGKEAVSGNTPIMSIFKHFSWDLRDAVDADQEELFGGPDAIVDWVCERCKTEQEEYLPLDRRFFGIDQDTRLRRKSRRSRSGSPRQRTSTPDSSSA